MREDTPYSNIIDPQWYCDPPTASAPEGNCGFLGSPVVDTMWPKEGSTGSVEV